MQNLDATTKTSQLASIPAITIDSAAARSSAAGVLGFEPEQVDDPALSSSTRVISYLSNANLGDQNEKQLEEDYNLTQNIPIASPRHQQQQTLQLITTIMNAQATVAAAVAATATGMTTASSLTAWTSAIPVAAVSPTLVTVASPSAGATLLWNAAVASQLREILLQHNVQLSTCSSIIASCLQNTSLVQQVIPTSAAERPPELTAASAAATTTTPTDYEQQLSMKPSETEPQKPHATALSTLTDVAVKLLVTSRTKNKPPLLRGTSSTFSNASIVGARARLPAQQDAAAASAASPSSSKIPPSELLPTLSSSIIYKPKSRFLAASIADDNAKQQQQQQQQQNLPPPVFGLKPVSSAAILADVIRHSISPTAAAGAVASSSSPPPTSLYTWKAISAVGSGGVVCDLTRSASGATRVSSSSSIGLMPTPSAAAAAAAAAAAILSGRLASNTSRANVPITNTPPFVVPLPIFTSQTPLTTSVTTLTLPTYSTSVRSHRTVFVPPSVEERKRVSSFEGIRASSYRVQEHHQRPPAPDRRLPLLVNRSNSSFSSMPPCVSSANVVSGVNDSRRTRGDQHNEFVRYQQQQQQQQQQQRAPLLLPAPVSAKLDISRRVLPVLAKILQQAGIEVDTATEPQRQRRQAADEGEAGKERAEEDEDDDEDDGEADDDDDVDEDDDDSDDVHILENVDDIPVTTHIVTGRRTATVYTQQRAPVVLQRLHSSRQQQQSYSLPNNTVRITTTLGGNESKQRGGDGALRSSTNSPPPLSAANLSPVAGTSTAVTVVHHMAGCSQSIDVTTTSRTTLPSVKTPLSAPLPSTRNLQTRRMLRKRASSSSLAHERRDESEEAEQQQRRSEQQSSQRQQQQQRQQRATLTISPPTTTASSSTGSSSSAGAYLYTSISGGAASSSTSVIGSSSKKSKSTSGVRGRPRHSESKSAKYARHHRDKMRSYRVKVHDERDRLRTVVLEQEEELVKLEEEKASLREQIHNSYMQASDALKPKLDLMLC